MGSHSDGLYVALSLILIAVYAYFRLAPALASSPTKQKLAIAVACAVGLALFPLGVPGRLFCLFCVALAPALATPRDEQRTADARADAVVVSAFSIIYLAIWHVPVLWQGADSTSHLISRASGPIFGQSLWLGPHVLGLPIILLVLISIGTDFALSTRRSIKTLAAGIVGSAVMLIGYLGLHAWIPNLVTRGSAAVNTLASNTRYWRGWLDWIYPENMPIVLLALLCLPLLLFVQPRPLGVVRLWQNSRRYVAAGAILLLLVGAFFLAHQGRIAKTERNVLVFDKGYLNFRLPDFTAFGDKSGGMFGLLPKFLSDRGWQVERAPLSEQALSRSKVLVLINVLEMFSDTEKKQIRDFVRRGGSVLVLGDHTGVMGIREPFNDLLSGTGIEFNFDSAKSLLEGWLDTYHYFPHPINTQMSRLGGAMNECEIWIGASLAVDWPAKPVLVGSYGFSDKGNLADPDRGYLGNVTYDLGEKLGDVVLVAESKLGKGKMLVYGDTSPFQNGALTFSHKYVERVFWYLSGTSRPSWVPVVVGGVLVVAGFAVLLFARLLPTIWLALPLFVLAWQISLNTSHPCPATIEMSDEAKLACIDISHVNRASLNSWHNDGFGGLVFNLLRNGVTPVVLDEFSPERVDQADFLFLIAPSRSFSDSEEKTIDGFLREGGNVILACGWEEKEASERLLRRYGISLSDTPLGRFKVPKGGAESTEKKLVVYKGWPLETDGEDHEVWCNAWGNDVIIHMQIGKGSLVAVGDSSFLLNKNLEGRQEYFPANVNFFRDMLTSLEGRSSD